MSHADVQLTPCRLSASGLDPVHDFVDYSYGDCYTERTSGQATRARSMWAAYRA